MLLNRRKLQGLRLSELISDGTLTYSAALITIILLAVWVHWMPPAMILWAVLWIIQSYTTRRTDMFRDNKAGILFILFLMLFLWQSAQLIFSQSFAAGFERIFKRLSFIIFPMVLFFPGIMIKKKAITLLRLFAVSVTIYLVYCYGAALANSLTRVEGHWVFNAYDKIEFWESHFMGARLSSYVHPSYLSMYVLLGAILALDAALEKGISIKGRFYWSLLTLVHIVTLYLLSSRAGLLAGIISLPLFLAFHFIRKINFFSVAGFILLLMVAGIIVIRTNDRMKQYMGVISTDGITSVLQKDIRLNIWDSALGVIKEHPVFGVGTGNASRELKKEFMARGYSDGYYDNMNSHNQFLEVQLENGLVGTLLFLVILVFMVYTAISERNLIFGLFVIMMIVFFIFESLLNRLAGITFFPLFSFLLIHYRKMTV